jgi:hypothetical protein
MVRSMDQGPLTSDDQAPIPPPTTPLPPPPTFPFFQTDEEPWVAPVRRPGQLSPMWRLAFGLGWAAIVACHAAIWETSRVIGLSTWWLGADAQPRFLLFQLLPFYGPLAVTIAAISNWRYLPYGGIAAAVVGAAIGAGDLGRVRWIAVVELALNGSALLISTAALAGMYRAPRPADVDVATADAAT